MNKIHFQTKSQSCQVDGRWFCPEPSSPSERDYFLLSPPLEGCPTPTATTFWGSPCKHRREVCSLPSPPLEGSTITTSIERDSAHTIHSIGWYSAHHYLHHRRGCCILPSPPSKRSCPHYYSHNQRRVCPLLLIREGSVLYHPYH